MTADDNVTANDYVSLGDQSASPPHVQLAVNSTKDMSESIHSEHAYHDSSSVVKRKLMLASAICAFFMIVEIIAGIMSNSLALITDALHLVSDLSSFLISLFALWVSNFHGTHQLSFGYHRAEILGALMSVVFIWLLTAYLIFEAFHRVVAPKPVKGSIMFVTALLGTLANVVMTYILGFSHNHDHSSHGGACSQSKEHGQKNGNGSVSKTVQKKHSYGLCKKKKEIAADLQDALLLTTHPFEETDQYNSSNTTVENVNLRAAYIHALGDLIQNIGVLIAATCIWIKPEWNIADPICTFIFSIVVLMTTSSIIKDATNVLMEGAPREIDISGLREDLSNIPNVIDVHDLHVWSLSVGKPSLACHMVIDSENGARRVLRIATRICQKKYGILHTTIQTDFSPNKLSCDTDAHSKCH